MFYHYSSNWACVCAFFSMTITAKKSYFQSLILTYSIDVLCQDTYLSNCIVGGRIITFFKSDWVLTRDGLDIRFSIWYLAIFQLSRIRLDIWVSGDCWISGWISKIWFSKLLHIHLDRYPANSLSSPTLVLMHMCLLVDLYISVRDSFQKHVSL